MDIKTPCLATHRIRQHITRPFNLQHGHLVLVQISEQLLDHGGVRTQHSGDKQNVHLAVLQRQILSTGKLRKQEERALELSRFRLGRAFVASGSRDCKFLCAEKKVEDSLEERLDVLANILVVQFTVQSMMELGHNLLLVRRLVLLDLLIVRGW